MEGYLACAWKCLSLNCNRSLRFLSDLPRCARKRSLEDFSPDNCAAGEHNEPYQSLAFQANPGSVPLDQYPATPRCCLLHDCLHVAPRFGVVALLDGPAHPTGYGPVVMVSFPNECGPETSLLYLGACCRDLVHAIQLARQRWPEFGPPQGKIGKHEDHLLG